MKRWKKAARSLCLGMALTMSVSWTTWAANDGATGPGMAAGNSATGSAAGNISSAALTAAAQNVTQPTIAAQGAVLYDATHNQFLFSKNPDTHYYPASITKLMTALLVAENCNLGDTVTFSQTAVTNLESGAVTLQVKAGDTFTVQDCLYGLLLKSANEVANGLAEHVSGSVSAFADKMNEKAASLGCTNTHFVNPNGLNNANHFTTAHDMALIANAAFNNATVRQVASTLHYNFPATASVPTVRTLTMGHKMLNPANAQYYEGIVGGKTGYTSLAGNTLVTCAERNGVRLIAVILKSSQTHYDDTKKLLDYGFAVAGSASGTPSGSNPTASGASTGTNNSASAAANNGTSTSNSTTPSGNPSTGASTSSTNHQGPGSSSGSTSASGNTVAQGDGAWQQFGNEWKYLKANGTYAAGESLLIKGETYYFRSDAWMARDWQMVNGAWHYYTESGAMAKSRWIQTNGYWYYVGADGALFVNGTTPDGYKVDANGVWIQK